MSADKFLTVKEVAEILRVSEHSVLHYIESGRLRASRIGQWRIKEKDLDTEGNSFYFLNISTASLGILF